MSQDPTPHSSIVLYTTEDGRARIECRFENETIWLTQALIAELFDVTPQNVTLHLKAIYDEAELPEKATCKDYLQVRTEGSREVRRTLRIVVMFLDYAEDQAQRRKQVFLRDWQTKLDEFLRFNERRVLPDAGTVSREAADEKALAEYELFARRRREAIEAQAEADAMRELEDKAKKLPKRRKRKED